MKLSRQMLEELVRQQQEIRTGLDAAEKLTGLAQRKHLQEMKPKVLWHLEAKTVFYRALEETCLANHDDAGAQLGRVFEANMAVQGDAVVRFFESVGPNSTDVMASFPTILHVLRSRFSTEERAVFTLANKHIAK